MSTFDTSHDPGPTDHGIVYKKMMGHYTVRAAERLLTCELSSRLRKDMNTPFDRRRGRATHAGDHTDPVAVGDEVRFKPGSGDTGLIVEVLPRRNKLSRHTPTPMPGAHAFEQVIVANLDQVVPVFAAAEPPPHWNLLDRYLAAAEQAGLPALICITKGDLAGGDSAEELFAALAEYRRIGYASILTSAETGAGLDELTRALQGRTSVFIGKSGVGKTSLLNAIEPGLGLRVKAVSQVTGKGRHTTTHLEMFPLSFGGALVDTPGTREFGLWETDEDELSRLFREMRPYTGRCKFGLGCHHADEPGCAVRKAVMAGEISPRRYRSYLRLLEDL